jgi:hypothetical protein
MCRGSGSVPRARRDLIVKPGVVLVGVQATTSTPPSEVQPFWTGLDGPDPPKSTPVPLDES